jgi:putative peptide zinc metalloprotease protein
LVSFFSNEAKLVNEAQWYTEFFKVTSVLYLTIIMLILKIPHEIGHGLAMKWINRNVHEMGIGFLIGTPCLYCDITDIYLEPKRMNRILVVLAGVYVDILVTSIAACIFLASPPGDISTMAQMTVFANLGYTMFVNLIPLTRFDGHYALAYAWGRQNLATDARNFLAEMVRLVMLDLSTSGRENGKSDLVMLFGFGVSAYIYRWILVVGVVSYMNQLGGVILGFIGLLIMLGLNNTMLSAWDREKSQVAAA